MNDKTAYEPTACVNPHVSDDFYGSMFIVTDKRGLGDCFEFNMCDRKQGLAYDEQFIVCDEEFQKLSKHWPQYALCVTTSGKIFDIHFEDIDMRCSVLSPGKLIKSHKKGKKNVV